MTNRTLTLASARAPAALLLAVLLAPLSATAETYKWIDERGVVTYSNAPPPAAGRQPKKVDTIAERVSVYTPDATLVRAMQSEPARDPRVEQLEKQLAAERQARTDAKTRSQARQTAAYDRCVAQRRIDCDTIRAGLTEAYPGDPYAAPAYPPEFAPGYYGPTFVVGAVRALPFVSRPFAILGPSPVASNPSVNRRLRPAVVAPRNRDTTLLR